MKRFLVAIVLAACGTDRSPITIASPSTTINITVTITAPAAACGSAHLPAEAPR